MIRTRFSIRTLLAVVTACATICFLCVFAWSTYRRHVEDAAIRRMTERFHGYRDKSAVTVRDGQVVLVQKGRTLGAFVTEANNGNAVRYRWYYRSDGKGELDPRDENVTTGTSTAIRQDNRSPSIAFGPFQIEWTRASSHWGWILYDRKSTMRLCITNERHLRGLDALDPTWRYKLNGFDKGAPASDLLSLDWHQLNELDSPFTITLEHVPGKRDQHTFRVAFTASTDRFLLPYPRVTGLRFSTAEGRHVGTWKTDLFVIQPPEAVNDEFVLKPNARIAFDLRAHANCEPTPDRPWTIDLPRGKLHVQFLLDLDIALERYDFVAKRSTQAPITIPWGKQVESNSVEFSLPSSEP